MLTSSYVTFKYGKRNFSGQNTLLWHSASFPLSQIFSRIASRLFFFYLFFFFYLKYFENVIFFTTTRDFSHMTKSRIFKNLNLRKKADRTFLKNRFRHLNLYSNSPSWLARSRCHMGTFWKTKDWSSNF